MDSRMAWYSVGASSTQLDNASSSYSLLQSIYGSQASQLPLSDYDSETSLIATQSEQRVTTNYSPVARRRLSRPKSSPASVIAAREQLRSQPQLPTRPGTALNRQQRPGSAAHKIARGRPSSAAVRRPSSAAVGRPSSAAVGRPSSAVNPVRGGASPSRRRPKTAMGFHRPSSVSSGSSTFLLDLEEEEGEDIVAPIIRETPPVRLTHTPEYFDFWAGKPLRERDFGVKPHKRKAWQRPKSDYGNRFINIARNKENNSDGEGGDGDGDGGLETLLERDVESSLSSRRGSRDFGNRDLSGLGDSDKNNGLRRLSISGEALGSRRGSKDLDGDDKNKKSARDRSTSRTGLRNKGGKQDDQDSKGGAGSGLGSTRQSKWGDLDEVANADDDDYFRNSTHGLDSNKTGSFLPDISDTRLVNSDAPTGGRSNRVEVDSKENTNAINRIHNQRERRALKQLQPTSCLPTLTDSICHDYDFDYESGKALASVSWMDGGSGSGSGNVTRFELPMDLMTLEAMSPVDYLSNHCIISKRRMTHCSKIFKKRDINKESKLSYGDVRLGLVEAHHNCVTDDQVTSVLNLVQLNCDAMITLKLFAALCCFAERMLNLFFLPLAKKDVIETVDFEALDWKLRDCTISDSLRSLFLQL